jgi:hypothetical protein
MWLACSTSQALLRKLQHLCFSSRSPAFTGIQRRREAINEKKRLRERDRRLMQRTGGGKEIRFTASKELLGKLELLGPKYGSKPKSGDADVQILVDQYLGQVLKDLSSGDHSKVGRIWTAARVKVVEVASGPQQGASPAGLPATQPRPSSRSPPSGQELPRTSPFPGFSSPANLPRLIPSPLGPHTSATPLHSPTLLGLLSPSTPCLEVEGGRFPELMRFTSAGSALNRNGEPTERRAACSPIRGLVQTGGHSGHAEYRPGSPLPGDP